MVLLLPHGAPALSRVFNRSIYSFDRKLQDWRDGVLDWRSLRWSDGNAVTISGGAITATHSVLTVDTEGGASNDSLDTISGGQEGWMLALYAASPFRAVNVAESASIYLNGATLLTLGAFTPLLFIRQGGVWCLISSVSTRETAGSLSLSRNTSFTSVGSETISWNVENYDPLGMWSSGTFITLKGSGATRYRWAVAARCTIVAPTLSGGNTLAYMRIRTQGSSVDNDIYGQANYIDSSTNIEICVFGIIDGQDGDQFQVLVDTDYITDVTTPIELKAERF